MLTLCVAGKNNIAVNVLEYIKSHMNDIHLVFIPNRSDNGIDTWQRSARLYCENNNVEIVRLNDVYNIKHLVFLSTEYDKIIDPEKFKSPELFNVHFSLLPKYKGMSTSILPILNGESETGVTLHKIRSGIDTGASCIIQI